MSDDDTVVGHVYGADLTESVSRVGVLVAGNLLSKDFATMPSHELVNERLLAFMYRFPIKEHL